jgi:catechol 2,3-dioxygenase-like lactoylglutathione lyase family enzyme
MEPRISLVTLGVTDLQKSLAFYRDGLGFRTTWDVTRGVIFFQTAGTRLALYPYDQMTGDVGPALQAPRSGFRGIMLAHNVRLRERVDEVLALAEMAGGAILRAAHQAAWGGTTGYFADPDGYVWEVAWGAFPIADDGTLQIP